MPSPPHTSSQLDELTYLLAYLRTYPLTNSQLGELPLLAQRRTQLATDLEGATTLTRA